MMNITPLLFCLVVSGNVLPVFSRSSKFLEIRFYKQRLWVKRSAPRTREQGNDARS